MVKLEIMKDKLSDHIMIIEQNIKLMEDFIFPKEVTKHMVEGILKCADDFKNREKKRKAFLQRARSLSRESIDSISSKKTSLLNLVNASKQESPEKKNIEDRLRSNSAVKIFIKEIQKT